MPRHYLIVDDSPVIRRTLEKMLDRLCPEGYQVSSAGTSEQALEIFRDQRPEVVFLDIQLPDADGEQTAQEIFSQAPETKVIVITGLMEDDERVRSVLSMGALDSLPKPIHSSDVQELLHLLWDEKAGPGRIE